MSITSSPDAGIDGAVTACDQGAAIGLFAELGGTPDAGGTWTDPNGIAHSGSFDPATDIAGNYTYSIGALAPCVADQSIVAVTITSSPDAGIDGAVTACDQGAAIGLFAELGGTPDAGGTWTDPNGIAHSGSFDPATDIAGNYTYSIGALAPCVADQSIVTVTITSSPDAGIDGAVTACDQGAAIGLFAELGGTPDAGGTWTDPNGAVHSGSFDPATDIAGNYTYSIGALAPCVADQSIVTVTITSSPDAGIDGAVTVCDQGATIGLFAELGGTPDAGGTWTDPNGAAQRQLRSRDGHRGQLHLQHRCAGAVRGGSEHRSGDDHQFAGCGRGWRGNGVRSRRSDRALRGARWHTGCGRHLDRSERRGTQRQLRSRDGHRGQLHLQHRSAGAMRGGPEHRSSYDHQFAGCGDRWRGNGVRSRRCDRALRGTGRHAGCGRHLDRSERHCAQRQFDPATDIAGNYTYSIGALAPCVADQKASSP
ncbi:MAG: hypothetical protein IPK99_16830 [Flavobacteriales bacterium]|nr:hypothetical protein [Flavobacteriales bacterium]